jgi:hypothetical protein
MNLLTPHNLTAITQHLPPASSIGLKQTHVTTTTTTNTTTPKTFVPATTPQINPTTGLPYADPSFVYILFYL